MMDRLIEEYETEEEWKERQEVEYLLNEIKETEHLLDEEHANIHFFERDIKDTTQVFNKTVQLLSNLKYKLEPQKLDICIRQLHALQIQTAALLHLTEDLTYQQLEKNSIRGYEL